MPSILTSLLLVFALLWHQTSGFSIPRNALHDPVPLPPHNEALQNTILTAVNDYRSKQTTKPLEWSDHLANVAFERASHCQFNDNPANGSMGETICGTFPSTFNQSSWANIDRKNMTKAIIDNMYANRVAYLIDPDTLQGQMYSQLVWYESKKIGCAWTASSCMSSITEDQPLYLFCEFSPKGNTPNNYKTNVRCNGCPARHEVSIDAYNEQISNERFSNRDHAQSLLAAGSTTSDMNARDDFDFASYVTNALSAFRADAGLSDWKLTWDISLTEKAQQASDQCNAAQASSYGVAATYQAPEGVWEMKAQTKMGLLTWRMEAFGSDAFNIASITEETVRTVGCAWSGRCGSTHILTCILSAGTDQSTLRKRSAKGGTYAGEHLPPLISELRRAHGVGTVEREPDLEYQSYVSCNKCNASRVSCSALLCPGP